MSGLVKGSIIQIHRARTVVVTDDGLITASEFGTQSMKNHPSVLFLFQQSRIAVCLFTAERFSLSYYNFEYVSLYSRILMWFLILYKNFYGRVQWWLGEGTLFKWGW